ncbi:GT2 family glycosyltransferase [Paenibacillus forsythiae]|uniref:GT2 family glycosyltransferase n=1 Tax=Paenibacillus forsythiae TaxID=365616 RepID=A0ABU3HFA2_9BACL|nr:glycosyltransferase family 2 protein [Paenibacillus forsythiae]MDT3428385.1 GT2 family glycosyltransferase [Paenibacillus forsythiae]
MTRTSIIIPTFNGLGLLRTCVDAIRRYTAEPYELIIVDNASSDGTAKYCRRERIPFISLPANAGFPIACNLGMQLASGDELLLLNNDVIVSKNWLANLKSALYSSPDTGIVGPVTNYASGRQQVNTGYADIAGFHAAAETANIPDPSKWSETKRLVGLCFLFKREVFDKVGLLDERFSPGHYEDDDYCIRARLQGYRLLIAGDCLVHHEGSASFKEVYRSGWDELIGRNRRLYIEKWGIDPRQFI